MQRRVYFGLAGLQAGKFMSVLERRRTSGVSQEIPSIRLWILLLLVVAALVLSGKVWPSLLVRTTPKTAWGNLQAFNVVTRADVMAELFASISLALACGFTCFPERPLIKAPKMLLMHKWLSIYPACQLGLICDTPFFLSISMFFIIPHMTLKMLFKSVPRSGFLSCN